MAFRDVQLRDWHRLSEAQAHQVAGELATSLPQDVKLRDLINWSYAGRTHRIARFSLQGSTFVLVPGGDVELGYDANRFQPSIDQLESYQASAEEYEVDMDMAAFVDQSTRSPLVATMPPMLVEAEPWEVGLEAISPDEPEIREMLEEYSSRVIEVYKTSRVRRNADGTIEAWRISHTTHDDLAQRFAADGVRLLSSDEWEYVCGAGATTLFRWGDTCPVDHYPTDNSADEVRRKREWALSGGTIPFEADNPDWDLHLRPNLFGLAIAQNPYTLEVVAEPTIRRGGDGGSNICGGAGFFLGWLPLATAFWDASFQEWLAEEDDLSNSFVRRVIPIM